MRKGEAGVPLAYEVMTLSEWGGPEEGEFLDIDWDVFTSVKYATNTIDARIEAFFNAEFTCVPDQVSVCYSRQYSHPTRPEFEEFVERLAEKYQARVQRLPAPQPETERTSTYKKVIPRPIYKSLCVLYYHSNRWLRQRGIY